MSETSPVHAPSRSELLQCEPIRQLMQDRHPEGLEEMADKLDEAMLWVVFNHDFVSCREREFADLYAELREARDFFRLLGRYLNAHP